MKLLRRAIRTLILEEYKKYNPNECPHEAVFRQVRQSKIFGEVMPEMNWDEFAQEVNDEKSYENPREDFNPLVYEKFDDWFLRTLAPEAMSRCEMNGQQFPIVSPCQGTVRKEVPSGAITLKKSIVHLDTLLGILNTPSILQISLRKTDYHRIHSPCDGTIIGVDRYEQNDLFKDSEACTIIDIECAEGIITMMMIGEWTVQTFVTDVLEGQSVTKLQELGYFYFGSQIIVGFDGMLKLLVEPDDKTRVFPGDPLFGEGL